LFAIPGQRQDIRGGFIVLADCAALQLAANEYLNPMYANAIRCFTGFKQKQNI